MTYRFGYPTSISDVDAGLFVCAYDIIIQPEVFAISESLIKIKDLRCLFEKAGITSENPTSMSNGRGWKIFRPRFYFSTSNGRPFNRSRLSRAKSMDGSSSSANW